MARCEKLLQKARNSASNLTFDEVCKLAECFGWVFARQNGTSHRIYKHPKLGNGVGSLMNFQRGDDGKAKWRQVNQLLDAIDEIADKARGNGK